MDLKAAIARLSQETNNKNTSLALVFSGVPLPAGPILIAERHRGRSLR